MMFPHFKAPTILTSFLTLAMVSLLASCSSSGNKEQEEDSTPRSFEQRVKSVKWDTSRRSSFERQAKTVKTDKMFRTGANFRTTEYHKSGLKNFNSGKKEFSQKSYQQAGRKARVADYTFRDASRQSRDANSTFSTSASRFGSQQSRYNDSSFRGSDQTFRTREDPMASKAMSRTDTPFIQSTQQPYYSEQDIKSVLGKQF